jgi:hypothetical protein
MGRPAFVCPIGLAALLLAGCSSDSGPATVPVSGTVYLDDEPLPGVEVNFFSRENDLLASARTGPDGRYELHPGAVPGPNKVWIVKGAVSDANPAGEPESPDMDPGQMEAMAGAATATEPGAGEDSLPEKYSDPDNTELTFTVPDDGTSSADFKLASQ